MKKIATALTVMVSLTHTHASSISVPDESLSQPSVSSLSSYYTSDQAAFDASLMASSANTIKKAKDVYDKDAVLFDQAVLDVSRIAKSINIIKQAEDMDNKDAPLSKLRDWLRTCMIAVQQFSVPMKTLYIERTSYNERDINITHIDENYVTINRLFGPLQTIEGFRDTRNYLCRFLKDIDDSNAFKVVLNRFDVIVDNMLESIEERNLRQRKSPEWQDSGWVPENTSKMIAFLKDSYIPWCYVIKSIVLEKSIAAEKNIRNQAIQKDIDNNDFPMVLIYTREQAYKDVELFNESITTAEKREADYTLAHNLNSLVAWNENAFTDLIKISERVQKAYGKFTKNTHTDLYTKLNQGFSTIGNIESFKENKNIFLHHFAPLDKDNIHLQAFNAFDTLVDINFKSIYERVTQIRKVRSEDTPWEDASFTPESGKNIFNQMKEIYVAWLYVTIKALNLNIEINFEDE